MSLNTIYYILLHLLPVILLAGILDLTSAKKCSESVKKSSDFQVDKCAEIRQVLFFHCYVQSNMQIFISAVLMHITSGCLQFGYCSLICILAQFNSHICLNTALLYVLKMVYWSLFIYYWDIKYREHIRYLCLYIYNITDIIIGLHLR